MSESHVPEWVEYEVKCPHCQVWFDPRSNPRMTREHVRLLEAVAKAADAFASATHNMNDAEWDRALEALENALDALDQEAKS